MRVGKPGTTIPRCEGWRSHSPPSLTPVDGMGSPRRIYSSLNICRGVSVGNHLSLASSSSPSSSSDGLNVDAEPDEVARLVAWTVAHGGWDASPSTSPPPAHLLHIFVLYLHRQISSLHGVWSTRGGCGEWMSGAGNRPVPGWTAVCRIREFGVGVFQETNSYSRGARTRGGDY